MKMKFHALNYYSKQPEILFAFYKQIGLHIVQEKESDDYYGAALALGDSDAPAIWIWSIPEGKEQPCHNHLWFTADNVDELYEQLRSRGIECPPPVKTFWGGKELLVTDPDGNTILFT